MNVTVQPKAPEIEYIFFASERTTSLNAWTDMVQHDFLAFGQREYQDNRTGAVLRVLWADIRIIKENEFKISLKTDIEAELRKASKARPRPSEFYSGVALYGCFQKTTPEYTGCISSIIDSLKKESRTESLESYEERKNKSLQIVELCLRSYNDMMDAYRLARLFGACEKLVIQPCIHDTIELTKAIGPWEMVHQSRHIRLSDFVQTCFIRPRRTHWLPATDLSFIAPGLNPPKIELQDLIQEFLDNREYDWCLHLTDAIEFLLEGDLSRSVIAGNIAVEVAVKQYIHTFVQSTGISVKQRDLEKLFEELSLSSQIRALLPTVAPSISVDSRVLKECDELRSARNRILHWGHSIKNARAVLRWLNAARELCLALHANST